MVNLDFSNVKTFEALEEGNYNATIEKAEEVTAKTGSPMIKLTYKIDGTESKVFDNLVLIPTCLWKTKELYTAIGLDTENSFDLDVAELVGAGVTLELKQKVYNGQTQNYVNKVVAQA